MDRYETLHIECDTRGVLSITLNRPDKKNALCGDMIADLTRYVISPYKMFSRHGYGLAWVSDRLTSLVHEQLINGPSKAWEFGTRDTGSYATMSDVVSYLYWLGTEVSGTEGS